MDWKNIIAELQKSGMSQSQIATEIGKSQAWVSAVLAGSYDDLKWGDGEALRILHAKIIAPADRRAIPGGRRATNHKAVV